LISILGLGFQTPENTLSNEFLSKLAVQGVHPALQNIKSRYSVLPASYIKEGKNKQIAAAVAVMTQTPTDLGESAVKDALVVCDISHEEVGLVFGDCATPLEIIPTEAQRITGRLGIKVPAYDVSGFASAFPLFLQTILSWKPEKLPTYVVCVSSNAPTTCVDYSKESSAQFFGDAAGAMVVSAEKKGLLNVLFASFQSLPREASSIIIDKFFPLSIDPEKLSRNVHSSIIKRVKESFDYLKPKSSKRHYVFSWLPAETEAALIKEFGISPGQIHTSAGTHGDSLGASLFISLTNNLATFEKGSHIVVISAGAGANDGIVILERG
jgi:3-oxoacyl-[acyl-carrier-protein] synthase III